MVMIIFPGIKEKKQAIKTLKTMMEMVLEMVNMEIVFMEMEMVR